MKKALAIVLLIVILVTTVSCSQKKENKKTLRITYDSSLYGTAWMDAAQKDFESNHPDISLSITADSQLTEHYSSLLQTEDNGPDLIFLARTDWQEDAKANRLSSLNTLFTGTTYGKSLLSILSPGVAASCSWQGQYKIYPWGAQTSGLLYNGEMFAQHGWQVPQTVSQLATLCNQMRLEGIPPFSWSADRADYWTDAIDSWWAQFDGTSTMQNYLAMGSPAVYGTQGRLEALRSFQQTVNTTNSYNTPFNMDGQAAVQAFLDGKAAMMPAGYLDEIASISIPQDFSLRTMALPAPDGAHESNLNVMTIPGIAVIPAKASSPSVAQQFLADLSTDAGLTQFMATTGHPTPFIMDDRQSGSLPVFLQNAEPIWKQNSLYLYSNQEIYYRYLFDWPWQGSPVLQLYTGTSTPEQEFSNNLQTAQQMWNIYSST